VLAVDLRRSHLHAGVAGWLRVDRTEDITLCVNANYRN